jgi:NADP-dependent 3-hydroxy acid dehydrogenase YdfG
VFSPGGRFGTKYAVRTISKGLRHELAGKVRVTSIESGAVDSELKLGIEQAADVGINEIVRRPLTQEF